MKYSQPTPVPADYAPPSIGKSISLDGVPLKEGKPALLHFFNPECPCSKFNFAHFRTLATRYSEDVNFVVVLQDLEKEEALEAFADYGLDVPAIYDQDGMVAEKCGVFATPQAVLLTSDKKIYYRGNYNKSRYCTIPGSNYTQMALDSLLANKRMPDFGVQAYRPYGCELPSENPETARNIFDFAL
ncbi:MAG: redoxin domain-containing protein [Cyclobacteriaceae bacterium]